jgi:peroxiredoxin
MDESGDPHKLKNKPAPVFKGATLDNKEISLEDLKGKIVIVDFWSLRCSACFKEIVDFNNMIKKYPKDKFAIISLLENTKEESLKRFEITTNGYRLKKPVFNNDKIEFQIIPDAKEIMKLYTDGIAFPHTFIVDQDGQITFYMSGYAEKKGIPGEVTSDDLFNREIDRLLSVSR